MGLLLSSSPVRYLVRNRFHKQRYIEINMRKYYIVLKTLEAHMNNYRDPPN